jgi:hypothetical protein
LLKGLIRWLVHIYYNPKAITKTEYSTFTYIYKEECLSVCYIGGGAIRLGEAQASPELEN